MKPQLLYGIDTLTQSEIFKLTGADAIGSPGQSVYEIVTDMIIKKIESEENIPWRKSWNTVKYNMMPQNFISKKPYRGINAFLLLLFCPYSNPYFLTFKQVEELGGKVIKGSSPFLITYFQKGIFHEQSKKFISKSAKEKLIKKTASATFSEIPFLKYYRVFNGEQITGIDFKLPKAIEKTEAEQIESCEQIIAGMPNRPIIKTGGQEAFYSPASDYIQIPDLKYFEKEQWYYSSLFHELVHSTKHPSRLGTNTIRKSGNTFGNKNYSMEELVAEMGAVFLCSHAGILYYTIENSAAYLKSWKAVLLKHLKEDKKFIFTASSEAQKAADYMLNISEVKNYNAAKIKALALEIELELVSLGEESSKFSEALKASNPFAIKRKLRFLKEHPEVVANPLSIFIGTQLGKVDESDLIVGRITKEVAKKALITEAIIYLESGIPGRNGFGLKHIKSEHQDILDYLGVSAIEFVKMICENFNEIREDKNGKIDLLVNANKQKLLVVALKEDEDRENYYRVITALICKRKEIIKRKLLYSKSPSFDNLSGISSALVKMLS